MGPLTLLWSFVHIQDDLSDPKKALLKGTLRIRMYKARFILCSPNTPKVTLSITQNSTASLFCLLTSDIALFPSHLGPAANRLSSRPRG